MSDKATIRGIWSDGQTLTKALEAFMLSLSVYAEHRPGCGWLNRLSHDPDPPRCTCGLEDAIMAFDPIDVEVTGLQTKLATVRATAIAALETAKVPHTGVWHEMSFTPCVVGILAERGYYPANGGCICGADAHNAALDTAIKQLKGE